MHKKIIKEIQKYSFPIMNEKTLQNDLYQVLKKFNVEKEYHFDSKSIVDFFVDGIAIEVKIKGSKVGIYKQCERYCKYDEVKILILVTSRYTGFPTEMNNKPVYIVHLSRGML